MAENKAMLGGLFEGIDGKVLQVKVNTLVEMLKKGDIEGLAKKINKMDKVELLEKMNDMDDQKLKQMKINLNDLQNSINPKDLETLKAMLGNEGEELAAKIRDLLSPANDANR